MYATNDPPTVQTPTRSPARSLHTGDAVALTVGSMIGAGIFTVLGLTVRTAGSIAVLSWVLVVLLSLPMAWTFSDLTGALAESGGPYVYLRRRTHRWISLWTAWSFLMSSLGATAALFMALVGMLTQLGVPWSFEVTVLIVGGLAAVLSLGIHAGVAVQRTLTVGTVALLLFCIVFGFWYSGHVSGSGLPSPRALTAHRWTAVFPATFYAFWTYSGWEAVAVPSGAYAKRLSLGRGMLIGSLLVGVLYILVAWAAVAALPVSAWLTAVDPLAFLGGAGHPWIHLIIAWGAVIVVTGSLLSWLLSTTALLQAVLRERLLPAPRTIRQHLGEYHPVLPLFVTACLVGLATAPIFAWAVAASSLTALVPYAIVFAAVATDADATWTGLIRSPRRRRVSATLALVMSVLLISFSGWNNLWPTAILLAIGGVIVWRHESTYV